MESGNSSFDWNKWGLRGASSIGKSGIQESADPTMQSIGDVASYTSTGAALGGPAGAVVGAGVGVVKSVFNVADARKARRAARRAKEQRSRRLDSMRKQEIAFRKKELAAARENKAYNRQQDINSQRMNSAKMQYSKLQNMMGDNKEFRRYMIENGYA